MAFDSSGYSFGAHVQKVGTVNRRGVDWFPWQLFAGRHLWFNDFQLPPEVDDARGVEESSVSAVAPCNYCVFYLKCHGYLLNGPTTD